MLALYLMTYYTQNNAGIISLGLDAALHEDT